MSEPPPAPAGILAYLPEPGQVGQARPEPGVWRG